MDPSFQFDADGLSDLQVLWEDGERVFCRGWRADGDVGRSAVLVVLPAAERPLPAILDHLSHEYELRDELDAAWAARPLALVSERGRTALLLEDPGGEPLERLMGEPMEVGRFLRLAIGIAAALGKAHQRGLVHKDVKPANILVNCADGRTRLTGFGIASRLPRERQAPEPPEVIAGTLAYMAPEQTGRMNRSINSRSDLYALGVTFYQILTGRLPFSAADPVEWVHCHIARRPIAPAERLESVPALISQMVMKLLAKTAEERYQIAAGLERDLRRCLAEWEHEGRIEPFSLGQGDKPDRLMIPEKLYGRKREVEALCAAFGRVVEGRQNSGPASSRSCRTWLRGGAAQILGARSIRRRVAGCTRRLFLPLRLRPEKLATTEASSISRSDADGAGGTGASPPAARFSALRHHAARRVRWLAARSGRSGGASTSGAALSPPVTVGSIR